MVFVCWSEIIYDFEICGPDWVNFPIKKIIKTLKEKNLNLRILIWILDEIFFCYNDQIISKKMFKFEFENKNKHNCVLKKEFKF